MATKGQQFQKSMAAYERFSGPLINGQEKRRIESRAPSGSSLPVYVWGVS